MEETIRFVKQAYEVEDVRLLRFGRLKAMVAIVLATAYFAMAGGTASTARTGSRKNRAR